MDILRLHKIENYEIQVHGNPLIYVIDGVSNSGKSIFVDSIYRAGRKEHRIVFSYNKPTIKNVVGEEVEAIFIFNRNSEEFEIENRDNYTIIEIFMIRDYRGSVLCTIDDTILMNDWLGGLDYVIENRNLENFHVVLFEDLNSEKYASVVENIFSELKYNPMIEYSVTKPYNALMSECDILQSTKNIIENGRKYFVEELATSSEYLKDFNRYFGYQDTLKLEELLQHV